MNMNEKVKEICQRALLGKCSPESFYDTLSEAAQDSSTDDDLACLLEDVLMEIEMEQGSKRIMKESAQRIIEEMDKII